jgi:hypothetical protein
MTDMQRFLADDRINGLRRAAADLRAERERDHRDRFANAAPAAAAGLAAEITDVEAHAIDPASAANYAAPTVPTPTAPLAAVHAGSPRVRLGHWLVGIGAAIAGTAEVLEAAPVRAAPNPCGDDPTPLSRAA